MNKREELQKEVQDLAKLIELIDQMLPESRARALTWLQSKVKELNLNPEQKRKRLQLRLENIEEEREMITYALGSLTPPGEEEQ